MISLRLQKIADMATAGNTVADIGTDHGFLPIELVRSGKAPRAIAMDIAEGPLDRAGEHIKAAGLAERIECRLSDGFEALNKGEADTAVIAGMGGDLIADIITRAPDKVRELILSPHTHYEKVRAALRKCGFDIIDESMFTDAGKYYLVIKAVRTDVVQAGQEADKAEETGCNGAAAAGAVADAANAADAYTDQDVAADVYAVSDAAAAADDAAAVYDHFGRLLLERRDGTLRSYLIHELDKFGSIEQKREYTELVKAALDIMASDSR